MLQKVKEALFKALIWMLGVLGYQPKACQDCAARERAKLRQLTKDWADYNNEPLRQFRWVMKCPAFDTFALKSAQRPTLHRSWEDGVQLGGYTSMQLVDFIAPSQARKLWDWFRLDSKLDISLQLLDGTGAVIETWEYKGCIPSSIDFGQVDYATSDPVYIYLSVQYDSVELK